MTDMTAKASANYTQEMVDVISNTYTANPTRATVDALAESLTRLLVASSLSSLLWASMSRLSVSPSAVSRLFARTNWLLRFRQALV